MIRACCGDGKDDDDDNDLMWEEDELCNEKYRQIEEWYNQSVKDSEEVIRRERELIEGIMNELEKRDVSLYRNTDFLDWAVNHFKERWDC